MQLRILKPGLLSTIQDMGRQKYLSDAVPVSGAMDTLSARIANKAVGNSDNAAVIEFTYANAAFIAETDLLIAYAGGGAHFFADEYQIPTERPIFVPAGTILQLTAVNGGSRTYMAIAGGWDVPEVLGSKSTFLAAGFGGFNGRPLKKGDLLKSVEDLTTLSKKILGQRTTALINYPHWSIALQNFLPVERKTLRIIPANEFEWFEAKSIIDVFATKYTIGRQSNRMGYHLEGPVIERQNTNELLSTAVTPGTIQVTGNGNMIILMADCQTTGGYPRLAQIAAVDLPLCAQLSPGDAINFTQITRIEAEKLYLDQEQQLKQLNTAIGAKFL